MKKYLILLLAIVIGILSFASCGDSEKANKDDDETTETVDTGATGESGEGDGTAGSGENGATTESSGNGATTENSGNGETVGSGTTDGDEEKELVNIIFNLDGGTALSGNSYAQIEKGGKLSSKDFPVVMKEGYALVGWKYGSNGEMWDKDDTFDKYTTLYAVWEKEGGEDDTAEPDGSFTKYDYDMSTLITLTPFLTHEFEVEEDAIKAAISSYLMQFASASTKTTCGIGDVVLCAYIGYYIDENGNIVQENGKDKTFDSSSNSAFYIGSNLAIADFENGIAGMAIGEVKDIYATFPSDYQAEDLAGKRVLFRVTLNSIYDAPEYNDAFVQSYFPTFQTTKEFEDALMKEYILDRVYDYIDSNAVVIEYPKAEYDRANSELEDIADDFLNGYGISIDNYLMYNYGMTRDEYIKSNMKTEMIFYYLRQLLGKKVNPGVDELIAKRESLIEEYKNQYISSNGMSEKDALASATEFVDALGGDYIFEEVMYEKIDDFIANVVITKVIESEREYCWEK